MIVRRFGFVLNVRLLHARVPIHITNDRAQKTKRQNRFEYAEARFG